MKLKNRIKLSLMISLFVGVTFAYFMWLTWQKLTEFIGNSNYVWAITGCILVVAFIFGKLGINKIAKEFL